MTLLGRYSSITYGYVLRVTLTGALIGLSVAGAMVKIPSPTGTVALDSFPGYLASLLLGYVEGCVVIAFGHIATAFTAGFPLGIPVHLVIAAGMALCAATLRFFYRLNRVAGIVAATLVNGVGLLYAVSIAFNYGMGFFYSMIAPLTLASAVNVLIAAGVYEGVRRTFRLGGVKG